MVKTKKTESTEVEHESELHKKRVRHSYLYAVGRRKKAVARVRLFKKGEGTITVNEKPYTVYFPTDELQNLIRQPLEAVGKLSEFNISIKTAGGGARGQAEASRHGIARVLVLFEKDFRQIMKPHGFMKRDPRRKERKKPGLKRARRAPQWAKR